MKILLGLAAAVAAKKGKAPTPQPTTTTTDVAATPTPSLEFVSSRFISDDECPEEYPFSYYYGRYCCKHGNEDVFSPQGSHCDGSVLGQASLCCLDDEYQECGAEFCYSHDGEDPIESHESDGSPEYHPLVFNMVDRQVTWVDIQLGGAVPWRSLALAIANEQRVGSTVDKWIIKWNETNISIVNVADERVASETYTPGKLSGMMRDFRVKWEEGKLQVKSLGSGGGNVITYAGDEVKARKMKVLMAQNTNKGKFTVMDVKVDNMIKMDTMCPASHPHAYYNGQYCCAHGKEKKNHPQHEACDGGSINLDSLCCHKDQYMECPNGKCSNYEGDCCDNMVVYGADSYTHGSGWRMGTYQKAGLYNSEIFWKHTEHNLYMSKKDDVFRINTDPKKTFGLLMSQQTTLQCPNEVGYEKWLFKEKPNDHAPVVDTFRIDCKPEGFYCHNDMAKSWLVGFKRASGCPEPKCDFDVKVIDAWKKSVNHSGHKMEYGWVIHVTVHTLEKRTMLLRMPKHALGNYQFFNIRPFNFHETDTGYDIVMHSLWSPQNDRKNKWGFTIVGNFLPTPAYPGWLSFENRVMNHNCFSSSRTGGERTLESGIPEGTTSMKIKRNGEIVFH